MRILVLALAIALAPPSGVLAQTPPPVADAEVRKGIAQVDDGEYDSAILTLDAASRRLAADKGHSSRDLAEAYFYLGVAYLGKGHETSAKARFREAVNQARDMSPSPEKFPPRVIELFEKAREESAAGAPAAAPSATASPAPKKGGGSKALLIGGAAVLVGGGVAVAMGGGGDEGSDNGSGNTGGNAQSRMETGTLADSEAAHYVIVSNGGGTLDVTVTWTDRNVSLTIDCQWEQPPYTPCGGSFNRTSDTSSRYTASVSQRPYLVSVSNFSGRPGAEPFTVVIRYP